MRTHNIPILIIMEKKKIALNYPKSAAMEFFQGTQEQVRNSRSKQAISVQATGDLPYMRFVTSIGCSVGYALTS